MLLLFLHYPISGLKKKRKKVNRAKKLKTKTVQRGMADEVEGR